ncbi:uncharacterized protein LOC125825676 [Solanum verrucosum]|uniref:uncharacterized protein LOC125825676 n=1 Tax=Solanum verrucosum TaxID=315347 RepID=UPI0020D1AA65|nr:uncharacterized protein LOC125825676 [Solanum verrucosum]
MNNHNNEENNEEINRKRKNFHTHFENRCENLLEEEDDDELLKLSLMTPFRSTRPRIQPRENIESLSPPLILENHESSTLNLPQLAILTPTILKKETGQRKRRNSLKSKPGNAKEVNIETITPPFPWATNLIATVHTLQYLLSKQLFMISGDVQCKRCERRYTMEFDLKEKFVEIGSYVIKNKTLLKERAPSIWMIPLLPTCQFCKQENSVKPIICADKNKINWLFLLLGQMLGCCTLDELKFFCEHTDNHRTGAKDRVLFLAYLTLCRQVDPSGPFYR